MPRVGLPDVCGRQAAGYRASRSRQLDPRRVWTITASPGPTAGEPGAVSGDVWSGRIESEIRQQERLRAADRRELDADERAGGPGGHVVLYERPNLQWRATPAGHFAGRRGVKPRVPGLKARPYLPNPSGPPVYSWNASQSATIFGLALRSSANTARSTAENARTVRSPSNAFSKPAEQRLHVSVRKNTARPRGKEVRQGHEATTTAPEAGARARPDPRQRPSAPWRCRAGAAGSLDAGDALQQPGGRLPRRRRNPPDPPSSAAPTLPSAADAAARASLCRIPVLPGQHLGHVLRAPAGRTAAADSVT